MINLLPPKEKEELLLQKNKKLAIVLGNMVLISLACLILVLFSLKFYILAEISYQKIILDNTERKHLTQDVLSLKDVIKKYNTSLVKMDNFYKKEIYLSDTLKTILGIQRPNGTYLKGIAINRDRDDNKVKVNLSGISDKRDNLLIFKDNIENNEKIENVYFPPDSWVKDKDIIFYLTFETVVPILKK